MSITIERPFPVKDIIVMRSTLFALANMGAKLQAYNEETGVIVATLTRRLGLQQDDVVVRVRGFEETAQLELIAPDPERAHELLQLVGTYVADGAKIQANATMQWVDMQRQQASQAKRRQLVNRAKNLLPGSSTSTETAVVPAEEANNDIVPAEEAQDLAVMPIPDNPGVLVKNQQDRMVELKIDRQVFSDRTAYLATCQGCSATVLKGSKYCANCGRPLTLEAVQPELRQGAQRASDTSLTYALIAIALNLVPILVFILPVALAASDEPFLPQLIASLTPLKLAIVAILGIAPSLFLGTQAVARARRAGWFLSLRAAVDATGQTKSSVGSALGWLAIYLDIAWVLFIVVGLLFG